MTPEMLKAFYRMGVFVLGASILALLHCRAGQRRTCHYDIVGGNRRCAAAAGRAGKLADESLRRAQAPVCQKNSRSGWTSAAQKWLSSLPTARDTSTKKQPCQPTAAQRSKIFSIASAASSITCLIASADICGIGIGVPGPVDSTARTRLACSQSRLEEMSRCARRWLPDCRALCPSLSTMM